MPLTDTQERYVNFYTDFAFKKLFGSEVNKELLISFLNSLFEGKEVIKSLKYLNVEHLGHAAAERKAVFDVYCENEHGEMFLIEMQKAEQDYFKDRSIYYSTFPIQEQAPRGKWNFELHRVYTIGILNFTFDNDSDDYMHHEVKLMDVNTSKVFFDKLTYVYLEMPKFRKEEKELVSLLDKWLYAIKNLANLMERPAALQEAVFQRLFEQAEIAAFNKEELHDYRESQKDFWDLNSVIETAEKKGLKKGMKEGMKKGMKQGMKKGREEGMKKGREEGMKEGMEHGQKMRAKEIARNLKGLGLPIEQIIEATGLSAEEIDCLK